MIHAVAWPSLLRKYYLCPAGNLQRQTYDVPHFAARGHLASSPLGHAVALDVKALGELLPRQAGELHEPRQPFAEVLWEQLRLRGVYRVHTFASSPRTNGLVKDGVTMYRRGGSWSRIGTLRLPSHQTHKKWPPGSQLVYTQFTRACYPKTVCRLSGSIIFASEQETE